MTDYEDRSCEGKLSFRASRERNQAASPVFGIGRALDVAVEFRMAKRFCYGMGAALSAIQTGPSWKQTTLFVDPKISE